MSASITRREVLKSSAGLLGLSFLGAYEAFAMDKSLGFKIGACDWSIQKMSEIDAIKVGKKIGLDGVQISLGTLANNMHLRQTSIQQQYKNACSEYGMSIGGIAIGEMNNIPYKSDPRAEIWVSDSIDVAKKMNVNVVLLAFFHNGDLKNDMEGTQATIRRLKKVSKKAEDNGIILGIESWLSAEEHMEIINAVDSPNIQVYYDVANSNKMGYNIYDEIRWLGKKHICEFHAKENGYLLGQGRIDFEKVKKAIDDIDYEGWIQIEGAVPENADMFDSYVLNNKYLRSVLKS
ncbi:sugar phosphate isomerase/epimerase family protein [Arenibacter echinorum]|uniref:Sugar phosphate isomerase/epimerase n=1 Tax=Arenibacter echinorum TaxID=440515 RepID=A0A327R346_9FLAO|nr:sugar phosphate isomerase/epimerase family protein [Arenibacter echinorum]RAJ10224.1 sugar phosphate isomerase/epimerase [Arenibacter echinorum]